jgi:hypothetical protein
MARRTSSVNRQGAPRSRSLLRNFGSSNLLNGRRKQGGSCSPQTTPPYFLNGQAALTRGFLADFRFSDYCLARSRSVKFPCEYFELVAFFVTNSFRGCPTSRVNCGHEALLPQVGSSNYLLAANIFRLHNS